MIVSPARRRAVAALAASMMVLAACATAPQGSKPAGSSQGGKPDRGYGEMRPIPNPNRRPTPKAAPAPTPAARPAVPPLQSPRTAPKPAPVPADAARAARLRASGLEQLNRGAVDQAIELLRQASRLAPGNALIRRDLDRALRIGRAVNGK